MCVPWRSCRDTAIAPKIRQNNSGLSASSAQTARIVKLNTSRSSDRRTVLYTLWYHSLAKVGVLRASHKIFLSLTGKFEWKFSRFHLCTAQTFHANSPVRLKKSLWDSRTTATLVSFLDHEMWFFFALHLALASWNLRVKGLRFCCFGWPPQKVHGFFLYWVDRSKVNITYYYYSIESNEMRDLKLAKQ
jgi:hypothetical protein